jgi:hypothetical protein
MEKELLETYRANLSRLHTLSLQDKSLEVRSLTLQAQLDLDSYKPHTIDISEDELSRAEREMDQVEAWLIEFEDRVRELEGPLKSCNMKSE